MKKLERHSVGIEQGSALLFSDFEDGGEMWTGEGPREARQKIRFSEPFLSTPMVHHGVAMWDADNKTNQRFDLRAEVITPEGFEIVFRTWGDSRVARIRADWIAIGEIRGEDEWEVD